MLIRDALELVRTSGPRAAWQLATHSRRMRRVTRQCLVVMGLAALEKCDLTEALQRPEGLDLRRAEVGDRHTLRAVCEYLYEVGVLDTTQEGVYRARHQRRFRNLLRVMYGYSAYHEPVQRLHELIAGTARYGRDVARDDRYDAMASADLTSKFSYQFSAALLRDHAFESFVDLGSGTGEYVTYLGRQYPHARFYGVDLAPEAIAEGRARGNESGRVQLRVGDMTYLKAIDLGSDAAEADLFSMMFVLHEFADPAALAILGGIRDAHPGARVLLTELIDKPSREVRKERRRIFPELKIVHELSGQILRTPEQWHALLARADLQPVAERRNALTNHVATLYAPA